MTTREEMALAFARAGYRTVFQKLERLSDEEGKKVVQQNWSNIKKIVTAEAVEMADLLIAELEKKNPDLEPTVR